MSIKINSEAGLKNFVDECILCGKCLEHCPVFLEPKFELVNKGPVAVIGKVVDLLQGGLPSEEAYRIVYGCAIGCTNICQPACPKGLELLSALIIAGQLLRTVGEGLPPLAYHHTLGHRYAFGHVFGNLQMKDAESPWLKEAPPE
ncbi:MAG: 4Fe-4S dicluster domain-containing protein, partial [Candidatus Latescibacterota bacterium]